MTDSAPPPAGPDDGAASQGSRAHVPYSPTPAPTGAQSGYHSPREEFRRARTRSQTVVFGSAVLGLVVVFLLGFLGVIGALPVPFGDEFSKGEVYAEVGDVPCPTQGARASAPDGVAVRVLNTTPTAGLASSVAEQLAALGYTIAATDNATAFHGVAKIEAGPNGVDAAYSLARFIEGDVKIKLSSEEDTTLTLSLGTKFEGLVSEEERTSLLEAHSGLVPLAGCVQMGEIPPLPQSGQQSGQSGQSGEQSG